MKDMKVELRLVRDGDVELLAHWLNKPYVSKWYNEAEDWLEEINGRYGEYEWIHHFIVVAEGCDIGFCQYYDCYDSQEECYDAGGPRETFSIDYMIGEEAWLGQGYGKAIVRCLTDFVGREHQPLRIVVQPDQENLPSNHVLMANGYVYDAEKAYYCKLIGS